MSEPPRPPGDGTPPEPTTPLPFGSDPASGYNPPPPHDPVPPTSGSGYGAGGYPPPSSGAGGYAPPPSSGAGGYPPPSSGAGGYPPGGGAPPPYGAPGYGAQQGYGAPGQGAYGAPPAGYATSDDRTWALLTHFGGAAAMFFSGGWLGWVPPLIALVAKGNQSPLVRAHAAAALNFQLLWSIVAVAITIISSCLSVIIIGVFGFFLLVIPWLMGTIFGVIAGVKAANGEPYSYPAAPNWIK
jgi:uncharacterized Tic20 family protein